MRKRDLEKLLFEAVADALGVEAKAPAKLERQAAPKTRSPQRQSTLHHRAAA